MPAFETGFISPTGSTISVGPWNDIANAYDGNIDTFSAQNLSPDPNFGLRGAVLKFPGLPALLPEGFTCSKIVVRRKTKHVGAGVGPYSFWTHTGTFRSSQYQGGTSINDPTAVGGVLDITDSELLSEDWDVPLEEINFFNPSIGIEMWVLGIGANTQARWHEFEFNFVGSTPDEPEVEEILLPLIFADVISGGTYLRLIFGQEGEPPVDLFDDPRPISYLGPLPTISSGAIAAPYDYPPFYKTSTHWGIVALLPITSPPDAEFTISAAAEMLRWPMNSLTIYLSDAATDFAASWTPPEEPPPDPPDPEQTSIKSIVLPSVTVQPKRRQ